MPRPPVLRSLLAPAPLGPLAAELWDLAPPVRAEILAVGDNDTYRLDTGDGPRALRVYVASKHWPCGPDDVQVELEWLRHLGRRGAPVAAPVERPDGSLRAVLEAPEGPRSLALFQWAPGTADPFPEKPERAAALGRGMAEIHRASEGFASSGRRFPLDLGFLVDRPMERIAAHLEETARPAVARELAAVADEVRGRIEAIPPGAPGDGRVGMIGGDFHGTNHHFDGDDRITFFDFDLCGVGWRAFDLAVYRGFSAKRLDPPRHRRLWDRVLGGYTELRPLCDAELSAIPSFVLAREIWLLGEHVADVATHGRSRLDDAYWRRALAFIRRQLEAPLEIR